MNSEFDLDAYLERIRYNGPKKPTLDVLRQLIQAHVQSIPFENLDVLLGRKIALDPASLVQKLVYDRRGGYCFEQNGLFLLVLEALGFQVAPVSARVRWQKPREFTPPRTHLFLRLEINGESWLADVGVGSVTPSLPLRLVLDVEQGTPQEPRRIIREESRYFRQIKIAGVWEDICESALEEMPMIDRELANWFTCAHPDSHFRNRLVAGLPCSMISSLNGMATGRSKNISSDLLKNCWKFYQRNLG